MSPDGADAEEQLESGLDIDVLRRRREVTVAVAALVLLLGTTSAAAYYFLRPRPIDLHQIVAVAEKAVQMAAGPDLRCVFPFFEEMNVTPGENEEYVVSGWAKVMNRNGREEPLFFRCRVVPGRGAEWVPAMLEFGQQ
jgi:hypothetical protein